MSIHEYFFAASRLRRATQVSLCDNNESIPTAQTVLAVATKDHTGLSDLLLFCFINSGNSFDILGFRQKEQFTHFTLPPLLSWIYLSITETTEN